MSGTGRTYCLVGTIRLTAGNLCEEHTSFVISHLASPRQKAGPKPWPLSRVPVGALRKPCV